MYPACIIQASPGNLYYFSRHHDLAPRTVSLWLISPRCVTMVLSHIVTGRYAFAAATDCNLFFTPFPARSGNHGLAGRTGGRDCFQKMSAPAAKHPLRHGKKSLCTGIARVYVTLARRFPFAATPAPRQLPAGSQTAAGMAALRRCLVLGNICSGSAGMKPKQRPPWERKHREYQQIRNP